MSMFKYKKLSVVIAAMLAVSGCDQAADPVAAPNSESQALAKSNVLNEAELSTLDVNATHYWPVSLGGTTWRIQSDSTQLQLLNQQEQVVSQIAGRFARLAVQAIGNNTVLIAALEAESNSLYLWQLSDTQAELQLLQQQVVVSRVVEDLCFFQSTENQQLSLFLLGGRGGADQLLLMQQQQMLDNPIVVRELNVPFDSTACAVDAASGSLFIAEADRAIWRYQAEPEADDGRSLLQVTQPFGAITGEIIALQALSATQLVAVQEEPAELLLLDGDAVSQLTLSALSAASDLSVSAYQDKVRLYISNEDAEPIQQLTFAIATKQTPAPAAVAQVQPTLQTEAATARGDVLDDPAVWHHPTEPALSLLLATDKRAGLDVYNMQGTRTQRLEVGRLNNVDVRYGLSWQEQPHDIAVASLRNDNSLQLFAINQQGQVFAAGNVATGMSEIYGLCMYQAADSDAHYVFVNDKSGLFEQYLIHSNGQQWQGEKVRSFSVPSQPEGCVADDRTGVLYVGEEDVGIWRFAAAADATTAGELIIKVDGKALVDDVEGLALAYVADKPLLVASSQGNDSYVIYDALPPYQQRLHFRVTTNPTLAIDGASETDGLEVTTRSLGPGFEQGALIVHDGRNRMPEQGQNLKLVPWQQLLEQLQK